MRVVIICDCENSARANAYPVQLVVHLQRGGLCECVQHGTFWLAVPEAHFDVVHIQWPEALLDSRDPEDAEIAKLRDILKHWKRNGTKIAVTIHNEYPHGRDISSLRKVYEAVYDAADGFVHLGEASQAILNRRYANFTDGKAHTIINHGDYSWLPNSVSKLEAKRILGIPTDTEVILVLGEIRSREELELVNEGFDRARLPNSALMVVGRLPFPSRKGAQHYLIRVPFFLRRNKFLHEGLIAVGEMQHYLNAASLLVIPRIHSINSGNVALGFTFGKVVVGPDYAVVGEQLRLTENPVYKPGDPDSLATALQAGLVASHDGKGDVNRRWASENMNWKNIALAHCRFYHSLLDSNQVRQPFNRASALRHI